MNDETKSTEQKPVVEVRHRSCQPSAKELKDNVSIPIAPRRLAELVMRDVLVREVK